MLADLQGSFNVHAVMGGPEGQVAAEAAVQRGRDVFLEALPVEGARGPDVLDAHHVRVLKLQVVDDLLAIARARGREGVSVDVQSSAPWRGGFSSGTVKVQRAGEFWDSMRERMTWARASLVGGV